MQKKRGQRGNPECSLFLLYTRMICFESCIIIVDTSKREWYNKENRQRGVPNEQEIHKGV